MKCYHIAIFHRGFVDDVCPWNKQERADKVKHHVQLAGDTYPTPALIDGGRSLLEIFQTVHEYGTCEEKEYNKGLFK